MEAQEVLRRSRESGEDEGKDFINERGDSAGFFALCIGIILLAVYKSAKGLPLGDVTALPFVFLSTGMFARHRQEGGRFTLVFGIISAVAAVTLLASFLIVTW